jgi:hypothetical protein
MTLPSAHHFAITLLGIAAIFTLSACGKSETIEVDDELNQALAPAPIDPQSAAVNDILQAEARKQAAGLGQGKVVVNGAWNYTGYSTLTPRPEARLVAVDITLIDYTEAFDYDDIEIVDAALGISYGSDPYISLLNAAGKPESDPAKFGRAPGPTRLLLIYGFPKDSKIFHLVYWGKRLNFDPIALADTGWEIPYPSPSSTPSAVPDTDVKPE